MSHTLESVIQTLEDRGLLARAHRIKAGEVEVELSPELVLPSQYQGEEPSDEIVDDGDELTRQAQAMYGAGASGWYPGADATS